MEINNTNSVENGNAQLLRLRAKKNKSRYEFKFKTLGFSKNKDIFSTFQKICRSYEETRMYRDIKLRGAIVAEGKLSILPDEKVFNKYSGISNLSKETTNEGQLYITNVRVVWFANKSTNFNISVPYIQIHMIKAKKSAKYGHAMVIATLESAGGYYLGRLFGVFSDFLGFKGGDIIAISKEIIQMLKTFKETPEYGVETNIDEISKLRPLG